MKDHLIIPFLFISLLCGCTSNNFTNLHTKGKVVTVKIKKSNGWTSSGFSAKKIQLNGCWAILTTEDGRTLIYPSESVIDIVIPKG